MEPRRWNSTIAAHWRAIAAAESQLDALVVAQLAHHVAQVLQQLVGEVGAQRDALLVGVIALELGIVALNVQFNAWNARFYNAIQEKDWDTFQYELLIFSGLAALFIAAAVYQLYLQMWLRLRWRKWMTESYVARWLRDATHFRMRVTGQRPARAR